MFETVVSTSLFVPTKFNVSVPTVTVSSEPLSAPIVKVELVAAVVAAVIRPCASTVITGIAELEPYEAAVTAVSSSVAVIVVPEAAVVIPVPPAKVPT